MMTNADTENRVIFATRCAASGTLAYLLAVCIGLHHPVWASMSALVVSQDSFELTRQSIIGRILGTIIGVVVAIIVGNAAIWFQLGTAVQIAVAVGLCALFAKGRPSIRVSLWTCPVVLLTTSLGSTVAETGLMRGSEVIVGALTGGLIHWLMRQCTMIFNRNKES